MKKIFKCEITSSLTWLAIGIFLLLIFNKPTKIDHTLQYNKHYNKMLNVVEYNDWFIFTTVKYKIKNDLLMSVGFIDCFYIIHL